MSYDIFLFSGVSVRTSDEAYEAHARAEEQDEALAPGDIKLPAMLEELLSEFPCPEIDDHSPTVWMSGFGPEHARDGHISLNISHADGPRVAPAVGRIASRHGVIAFDPQSDRFLHADDAMETPKPRRSSRPWWKFWGTGDAT